MTEPVSTPMDDKVLTLEFTVKEKTLRTVKTVIVKKNN